MRNVVNEKPDMKLGARLVTSLSFVNKKDIVNKVILDVGCGYGWFELHALKNDAKSVAGIEISKEDLKTIRSHIKDKKLITKVGSALKIPFPDNYFDTVVCWEVIEHIPKKTEEKLFKEVNRVLKAEGKFYLSTPHSHPITNLCDPARWLVGHRHYSSEQLVQFGLAQSFRVEKYMVYGRYWSIVGLLNMYISKWMFRRSLFFEDFIAEKESNEYKMKGGIFDNFIKYKKISIV